MESEKSEVRCNGENKEEEEKMEQFFALIRNFQEARDRRRDELRQREEITEKKKQQNKARRLNQNNTTNEQSNWVPCFEWADFTEEIEFRRTPIIFPTLYNNKEDNKKQRRDDDGLDLKLTL
ncbi:hypothetical protein V6N13_093615 [Hibiscus sabdariffa]|uniref:Protein NIM1-INTERACTING 1 n=2 Tax=Hibiscus sabdariffa TaxID=183260 RepID=A0ABR2NFZ5_9ROSI